MSVIELSGTGVWSMELRYGDVEAIPAAAAELEELGYTAIWVPDAGGPLFDSLDLLLRSTRTLTVATGILNVWQHTPQEVATWWGGLDAGRRDRTVLGLGISHGPLVGDRYERPLATMSAYLDGLEEAGVPLTRTCLAALGPKMLELAATRTGGAHPYLVTTEHTAAARAALGTGLLAVEQTVCLDPDPDAARERARAFLQVYGTLPNYAGSWRRLGYSEQDVAQTSDALVDALVACGDERAVRRRLDAQVAAGADHVCLQALPAPGEAFPSTAWRTLAPG